MSSKRGVYYDPLNPIMLSPLEISRLTPQEAQAACDQIDQNLVGVLQEIDATLARSNEVVVSRIIPAVQKYGENSQRIWESVKFWKMFFEASASTSLSTPYTGDESIQSSPNLANPDASLSFEQSQQNLSFPSSSESTPRALPHLHSSKNELSNDHLISPFEALKADLQQFGIPSSAEGNQEVISKSGREVFGARGVMDSPEISFDQMDELNLEKYGVEKGKERAFEFGEGSPGGAKIPRLKAGQEKLHPALLQKVLRKNFGSNSPAPPSRQQPPSSTTLTSTPGNKRIRPKVPLPEGLTTDWNGIADLSSLSSTTPLSAFSFSSLTKTHLNLAPPSHSYSASHSDSLTSPPSLPRLSYKLPEAAFSPTPKKEAAKRVVKDVYEAYEGSPMASPPSVVKNWGKRGYGLDDDGFAEASPAGTGEGGRKGFEEEDEHFGEEDSPEEEVEEERFRMDHLGESLPQPLGLAEYGGGTTARIEDLLNENSFAKVVDDELGGGEGDYLDEDDDVSYIDEREGVTGTATGTNTGHEGMDEAELGGRSGGGDRVEGGRDRFAPPEDTLFGLPPVGPSEGGGVHQPGGMVEDTLFGMPRREEELEDSFEREAEEKGFRVMGMEEMHTFHGGDILESQPFEDSPLAGRRHR